MLLRIPILLAFTASAAFAISEENVKQTYNAGAGGNLVVDVNFGTIDVASAADDKVSIDIHREIDTNNEETEKQFLTESPIELKQDGNTVRITARRISEQSWRWTGNVRMDAKFTVRVPKKFNLDLRTGGGTVLASDVEGTTKISTSGGKLKLAQLRGPLDAHTSGGSIAMSDCEGTLDVKTSGGEIRSETGGGKLDARTSGGAIVVRDFKGDATVKTSGGGLKFENVTGKVFGATSGGSISAALVSPLSGDVELTSSAGSIELSVPADAKLNLQATAHNGRV
ncbi:MAG TPA: DUF4097 family beta strand repeat-containing protein, partial [Chthoniobacterales bacterium]